MSRLKKWLANPAADYATGLEFVRILGTTEGELYFGRKQRKVEAIKEYLREVSGMVTKTKTVSYNLPNTQESISVDPIVETLHAELNQAQSKKADLINRRNIAIEGQGQYKLTRINKRLKKCDKSIKDNENKLEFYLATGKLPRSGGVSFELPKKRVSGKLHGNYIRHLKDIEMVMQLKKNCSSNLSKDRMKLKKYEGNLMKQEEIKQRITKRLEEWNRLSLREEELKDAQ